MKQLYILSLLACAFSADAGFIGVYGPTKPIVEKDAVEFIKEKLQKMEKTGELDKYRQDAIDRSKHSIANPRFGDIVGTATERNKYYYDPTFTLDKSIKSPDGKIIALAGTRINPLEKMSYTKTLIFFDGANALQVENLKPCFTKANSLRYKPILIGGQWMDLTKEMKVQFYFDQHGLLTKKFGIRNVPAVVRQEGKLMAIEEIPADKLKGYCK